MTKNGKWKTARSKGKYLFPVKAMSKVFRAKYVQNLKGKLAHLDKTLISSLFKKDWVVYAKRPFGHSKAVLEYLGRYTHKIAISNHRIKAIDKHSVTFSYKDYRKGAQKLEMVLEVMEFIRRFTMHVLPRGFVRIRHYGILSSSVKKETIPAIFDQLGLTIVKAQDPREIKAYNPQVCPCCQKLSMVSIQCLPKRGPPGKLPFHKLS